MKKINVDTIEFDLTDKGVSLICSDLNLFILKEVFKIVITHEEFLDFINSEIAKLSKREYERIVKNSILNTNYHKNKITIIVYDIENNIFYKMSPNLKNWKEYILNHYNVLKQIIDESKNIETSNS